MCGIAGFVDFSNRENGDSLLKMTNALQHRGPDGYDTAHIVEDTYQIGLGHRRLSIIDLSPSGKQPMKKHGLTINYNGEIYNYKSIKAELIDLGYSFTSTSDTEVMLSAFDCWGVETTVSKLTGMFAIVLYDSINHKAYFIRDRAGVKPFYYYEKDGCFLFASELKAFKEANSFEASIDSDAIFEYFTKGYVSTPRAIFQHCKKLKQGSILTIDLKTRNTDCKKYWSIYRFVDREMDLPMEEVLHETEKILSKAFHYRMVADTPVGVFLSGGIDSSLVTALLQKDLSHKLKTYTIGFEDSEYDESDAAKSISNHLGTEHMEFICTLEDAKKVIPLIPKICDEPFGDSSLIPTYLVSKMAASEVKVALSSDGGDELFTGYRRYMKAMKIAGIIKKNPTFINSAMGRTLRFFSGSNPVYDKMGEILTYSNIGLIPFYQTKCMSDKEVGQLLLNQRAELKIPQVNSNALNSIFAFEYENYMQDDILVKVDRATMANSLEGREPFLDHTIAEWSMSLPVGQKFNDNTLKYILKQILYKYVPKELMDRPKSGFSIPIADWLRGDLNDLVTYYLDEKRIQKQGIFSSSFVEKKLHQFKNGKLQAEQFVWNMLVFQMWYEDWFE
ncbi:MAG: asparagine synthase (glutamine-hydrolyzing) [Bacteroidota bacterium]